MKNIIGKIRIEKEELDENVTFEVIPATEWSEGHKRVDCDLARGFIPFDIKEDVNEEVIKRLLHSVAHATLGEKVNFLDGEMTGLTFEEIGIPTPIGEDEEGREKIKEVETFLNVLCEDVFVENARSIKDSLMEWAIQFFGIEFVPLSDDGELDSDDDSDDPSTIEF